ncbi:MAG: flagellin FliC [Magnetococcales bacterium]|jgi:flagellin|nr:flagellin FliC [Magnetococcales bacterium]
MTISINTNIASLMAYRGVKSSTSALGTNMQRLASGLKINSAKDDAGGLAVATRMMTQIRGLNVVKQNANDGLSLTDVAYAALDETTNAIQNIRDLAVEASNSTYSSSDRESLQLNVSEMLSEIQRIATATEYNNLNLLTGSFLNQSFQIGPNAGDAITVTIDTASLAGLGMGTNGVSVNVSTAASASHAITIADSALDAVSTIRAQLSGIQSRFESIINTAASTADAYASSVSGIMDTDVALESAYMAKNTIIQQAGISVLAQANQQPKIFLKLLE